MAIENKKTTLPTPITLEGKEVTELNIRKPKAGDMRGLKTADILQMDINAFAALMPRICPSLSQAEFYNLDPDNLTAIQVDVVDFFVNAGV